MLNSVEKCPGILRRGDNIAVIAPSRSLDIMEVETRAFAEGVFSKMGLEVNYFPHVCAENGEISSRSDRLKDLHGAFADPTMKGVICAFGGYHFNDMLPFIDWDLIARNMKPFLGFSDITVFLNAVYTKTGMIGYHGPNYCSYGMKQGGEHQIEYFQKALMSDDDYKIEASDRWSDDAWYLDQENRNFHDNKGPIVFKEGAAEGIILGGNLSSLALLQGTDFMPNAEKIILCVEEDALSGSSSLDMFVRGLRSLCQQKEWGKIEALCIGRFPADADVNTEKLYKIIAEDVAFQDIPVITDMDFGHTYPNAILPIGARGEISAIENHVEFVCKRK